MPHHENALRMRHMLDASREAMTLAKGKARKDLDGDRLLALALTRLLEIMGEAAGRVSKEIQALHPEIPWAQIVGLRNRLIHGYDSVDMDILWAVITEDLPRLVAALEKAAPPEEGGRT